MIKSKKKKGAVTIQASGPFTVAEAAEHKTKLLSAMEGASELHVQLEGITAFDTAGLQLLIMLRREADRRGLRVVISSMSKPVNEVLELYDAYSMFSA